MKNIWSKIIGGAMFASLSVLTLSTTPIAADELTDRVAAGKTVRIGFSNEPPWAIQVKTVNL